MKNFFPERKHASILTHALFVFTFFILFFLNPYIGKASAIKDCKIGGTLLASGKIKITVGNLDGTPPYTVNISSSAFGLNPEKIILTPDASGTATVTTSKNYIKKDPYNVLLEVKDSRTMILCNTRMDITKTAESIGEVLTPVTVCTYAGDKESACNTCLKSSGIWTAIGCIPFNQDEFVVSVVRIIMGVAGMITLVMMLVATIMLMTGGGNQEQMKRGKEIFTGAVVGLLFLIFSVVILQIITKDIIKLDISEPAPINHGPKPLPAI
ncbi:MAG: hypothetical protein WAV40_02925 [Microgenomates group bacterium]